MAYPAGEPEVNRLTSQTYTIDASYSIVVAYDYEIGLNNTTEISALGVLEIL